MPAPTLTGFAPALTFNENTVNATPQLLDSDVTFTDAEGDFNGGFLTLSGLLAEDRISVRNEGSGAGQIGLSGANVTFGGVVIGTLAGGSGATLTITFNASATSAAIDALIQNLTYANVSNTPTATRNLVLNVTDAGGSDLVSAGAVIFAERTGTSNPFDGVNIGLRSTPTFADLDGDGDLDAVVGEDDGVLNYFQNTGTASAPVFTRIIGAANPFNGVDVGNRSNPAFADLDGDGDLDALVGEDDGTTFNYFENTGTASAPVFTARTGAANPFNGLFISFESRIPGSFPPDSRAAPTFADLDGDGDLDAVVGGYRGFLTYFENTGTASAPVFTERRGAANPFNGVDVGYSSTPTFADLDGDGDLDALVGEFDRALNYFENTGTVSAPVFTARTGAANPFNGVNFGSELAPTFADLDGDGDLDAVVGRQYGSLHYFENTRGQIISVTVTAANDVPTAIGLPTDVTVTEDVASNLNLSSVTLSDADTTGSITVVLTASAGTMTTDPRARIGVTNSGTGAITLTGTASDIDAFLNSASAIRYTGALNANGDNAATVTVTANDGSGAVTLGVVNIDITAVNDVPTATGLPTDVTVVEDVASNLNLSAVTLTDIDTVGSITVVLTASAGTMTASSGGGVTVTNSGTGAITLSGTAANIDAFLNTASAVRYTGAANANGDNAATLTITADDGSGAVTLGVVNIDITAVNVTGLPTDVTVVEDVASNLNLSAVTLTDVGTTGSITVVLTASAGTMTASSGGGVTVTNSGTGAITLSGTVAAIDAFLNTVSAVRYTGAANANGDNAATVTVTANDGSGAVTLGTVNVDITAVNDVPTATGLPTDVTVTEDVTSNLNLSAVTLADVDTTGSITVVLTASAGTMTASSGGGVTVTNSGTGAITLSGTVAAIDAFLNTVSAVRYTGALNANGNNAATVTVTANDGSGAVTLGTVNVDITAVNDVPTATGLPTDVTVTEDVASNLNLSAVTLADVDTTGSITVVLTASAGTMTASSGGSVTVTNSGSGAITLTGTVAAIDAFLNTVSNIQYSGALNANGDNAATVTVTANDGSGAVTLGVVNIDITAVNDVPTATGLPTDVTVVEDVASNLNLSAVTLADVDTTGSITVVLTASAGTMTASSGGEVTVTNSGTGAITLTGTAANIDAFLNTVSAVRYTGALNANGNNAATVTVTANDGSGAVTLGTVNVDITAVNDVPTATGLPTDVTVTEDVTSNLNLSAVTLADVDTTGSITVVLTASAGTMTASSGGGVTVTNSGTGAITLTGTATNIDAFLNTDSAVRYTGALNANGNNAATVTVTANDGSGAVTLGTVNVDITAVNDAPTATGLPTQLTVTENLASNLNLSAVTLADVDTTGSINVVLTASAGTMTATSGGSVTVTNSGTGAITLTGTASAIDAYLNTASAVQYTGALNANGNGAATVTVTANDGSGAVTLGVVSVDITAVNGVTTTTGTAGADTLNGTAGADAINGLDGNDVINGLTGNDILDGGAGNDAIAAGLGNDTVRAGAGNDVISGDGGSDVLHGDDGDDAFLFAVGEPGGSTQAFGGAGTDTIILRGGGASIDLTTNGGSAGGVAISVNSIENIQFDGSVDAGGGNRLAYGSDGNNAIVALGILAGVTFEGRGGDDLLIGGGGADSLLGGDGDDNINGADGNDTIEGGAGADHLLGGLGADWIYGGVGNDVISGDGGSDVLFGGDGDDAFLFAVGEPGGSTQAYGGAGTDTVILRGGGASIDLTTNGGSAGGVAISVNSIENVQFDGSVEAGGGARLAYGSAGANALVALGILAPVTFEGRGGDDLLVGGEGADSLSGGDDNDIIKGNGGDDVINGGSGTDLVELRGLSGDYVITAVAGGYRVTDAVSGRDGSDLLSGIETLRFSDGSTVSLPASAPVAPQVLPAMVGDKSAPDGPEVLPGATGDKTLFDGPQTLPGTGDSFILAGKFDDAPQVLPGTSDDLVFDTRALSDRPVGRDGGTSLTVMEDGGLLGDPDGSFDSGLGDADAEVFVVTGEFVDTPLVLPGETVMDRFDLGSLTGLLTVRDGDLPLTVMDDGTIVGGPDGFATTLNIEVQAPDGDGFLMMDGLVDQPLVMPAETIGDAFRLDLMSDLFTARAGESLLTVTEDGQVFAGEPLFDASGLHNWA